MRVLYINPEFISDNITNHTNTYAVSKKRR